MNAAIPKTMKRIALLTFVFLLVSFGSAFAETQYLASLPDVPLMPQMREIKDSVVTFDKAEGRIVQETVKASRLTGGEVAKFYSETLPALGWNRISSTALSSRFSRNGEQLIVNAEKLANEGLVAFAVSPIQP